MTTYRISLVLARSISRGSTFLDAWTKVNNVWRSAPARSHRIFSMCFSYASMAFVLLFWFSGVCASLMLQWRLCFSFFLIQWRFVLLLCFKGVCASLMLQWRLRFSYAQGCLCFSFWFNGVCASLLLLFPSAFLCVLFPSFFLLFPSVLYAFLHVCTESLIGICFRFYTCIYKLP